MSTRPELRRSSSSSSNSLSGSATGSPLTDDHVALDVHAHRAGLERRRAPAPRARRTAEHGADARHELARGERLGDVVVGAELEAHDLVDLAVLRRDHDDRHVRALAQVRHTSVPDMPGSMRSSSTRSAPCWSNCATASVPVAGDADLEALLAEHERQGVGEGLLVLDDEHTGHGVDSLSGAGDVGCGLQGQPQGERRALALHRPHGALAAVVDADVLDDGQAEAGATGDARARRIDAVEPLEDAGLLALGDADALVGHGDLDRVVRRSRAATATRVRAGE